MASEDWHDFTSSPARLPLRYDTLHADSNERPPAAYLNPISLGRSLTGQVFLTQRLSLQINTLLRRQGELTFLQNSEQSSKKRRQDPTHFRTHFARRHCVYVQVLMFRTSGQYSAIGQSYVRVDPTTDRVLRLATGTHTSGPGSGR